MPYPKPKFTLRCLPSVTVTRVGISTGCSPSVADRLDVRELEELERIELALALEQLALRNSSPGLNVSCRRTTLSLTLIAADFDRPWCASGPGSAVSVSDALALAEPALSVEPDRGYG